MIRYYVFRFTWLSALYTLAKKTVGSRCLVVIEGSVQTVLRFYRLDWMLIQLHDIETIDSEQIAPSLHLLRLVKIWNKINLKRTSQDTCVKCINMYLTVQFISCYGSWFISLSCKRREKKLLLRSYYYLLHQEELLRGQKYFRQLSAAAVIRIPSETAFKSEKSKIKS